LHRLVICREDNHQRHRNGLRLRGPANEDVAKEEAEIQSGAPLEIPEVPLIPTLPMQVGNGKLAAAAVARHDGDADSGA
jgi:hypothetical protein